MRRIKLKTPRLRVISRNEIHDRMVIDPTHRDVAPINVADPYEAGATITVMRSLRDDPLGAMHAAGQLDECQYLAGRYWQKAYELAEIGGARAIDYSQDRVDGGKIPEPTISDTQARAFRDLSSARKSLGDYGSSVVYDILARGMTVKECATRRMMTREIELNFIGRRFRECLDTMAVVFNLATA
jgi:hypothetical protein